MILLSRASPACAIVSPIIASSCRRKSPVMYA
jgi:hypothetical protein